MPRTRTVGDAPPEVVARYEDGELNAVAVGALLGCSDVTALKRLRAAGAAIGPRHGRPRTRIPPRLVRDYRERRVGIKGVARAIGSSYGAARAALAREGVAIGRRGVAVTGNGPDPGRTAARCLRSLLSWLRAKGYSREQLAEVMGVTASAVTRFTAGNDSPDRGP